MRLARLALELRGVGPTVTALAPFRGLRDGHPFRRCVPFESRPSRCTKPIALIPRPRGLDMRGEDGRSGIVVGLAGFEPATS
jgi:hypothetical protein